MPNSPRQRRARRRRPTLSAPVVAAVDVGRPQLRHQLVDVLRRTQPATGRCCPRRGGRRPRARAATSAPGRRPRAGPGRWPAPTRVASLSQSRVRCRSVISSSRLRDARGTRRTTCGTGRRGPRGSGRPGAARAAGRPARRPAGSRRGSRAAPPRCRAVSSEGSKPSSVRSPSSSRQPARRCRCGRGRTARRRPGSRCSRRTQQVEVDVDSGVARGAGQRVAGGVDAHGLDQVLHRRRRCRPACSSAPAGRRDQVDHLADQDLEVLRAGCRRTRRTWPSAATT